MYINILMMIIMIVIITTRQLQDFVPFHPFFVEDGKEISIEAKGCNTMDNLFFKSCSSG